MSRSIRGVWSVGSLGGIAPSVYSETTITQGRSGSRSICFSDKIDALSFRSVRKLLAPAARPGLPTWPANRTGQVAARA